MQAEEKVDRNGTNLFGSEIDSTWPSTDLYDRNPGLSSACLNLRETDIPFQQSSLSDRMGLKAHSDE
jgi:hypothetical protein